MTASLDSDAGAYHELLERLTSHLRAYYRHRFARIRHGLTEAEDLLQEALMAIHTHRHTYDQTQPFTPWVYAIARYKFLDYLRRTKSSFKDMPIESAEELIANSDIRGRQRLGCATTFGGNIAQNERSDSVRKAGGFKRERRRRAQRNV